MILPFGSPGKFHGYPLRGAAAAGRLPRNVVNKLNVFPKPHRIIPPPPKDVPAAVLQLNQSSILSTAQSSFTNILWGRHSGEAAAPGAPI